MLRGPRSSGVSDTSPQTPGQQLVVVQGSFLGPLGSRIPYEDPLFGSVVSRDTVFNHVGSMATYPVGGKRK